MSERAQTRVQLLNEKGLHLHVAGLIARAATKFQAEVSLVKGEIRANAKSVMSLTLLAAPCGTELDLICEGKDADRAMTQLVDLFESRFGAP